MLAVGVGAQRHPRPGRRVHERVVDERAADLEHAQLVAARDRAPFDATSSGWSFRSATARELLRDELRDRAQVDRLVLDPHPAGIETREVEQVRRQLRQPVDLLAHRLEELLPRRLVQILVRHQLEEAAEREERRAQLVRGVRDELAARAVELLEPDAHPFERGGELAQLVVARVDDRLVEAPPAIRSAARSSRLIRRACIVASA